MLGLETGTIKLGIASGSGAYVREAGYGDLPFNTSTGDLRSVHVRGLETGTINLVIASFFCACAREAGYGDLFLSF